MVYLIMPLYGYYDNGVDMIIVIMIVVIAVVIIV
jgi:hypothetical protein